MVYLLAVLVLAGHVGICIFVINRLHATALPPWVMKVIDICWYGAFFSVPLLVAAYLAFGMPDWLERRVILQPVMWSYVTACWFAVAWSLPVVYRYWADHETTSRVLWKRTRLIDTEKRLGRRPACSRMTYLAGSIPTNQAFTLSVSEKVIEVPRLVPALDELSIVHLSDLHFTGKIAREFFEIVVEEANAMDADLIVISGDIIDKRVCLHWIDEILGRLESRYGVFFVLGNHDLHIHDEPGLRARMVNLGFHDLGGRWEIIEIKQTPILLAGNELPWFVPAADMKGSPGLVGDKRPLRIAVSHSPDQLRWAQVYDFDVMLAGHTHGGQIRMPIVGPVFAPSRYGVKYSAGTFYEDPTILHVSRGLSGTRPLRFNCPPEVAKLVLKTE